MSDNYVNHCLGCLVISLIITLHTGATALSRATFGQGTGQIWLDDVRCTSTETMLIDCPASPLGTHNCAHFEDAGVRCQAARKLQYKNTRNVSIKQNRRWYCNKLILQLPAQMVISG